MPAVIDWKAELGALADFMRRMPFKVPLHAPVGTLAAGERQKTEIIKQLYLERRFLVLDEPTSVLTPQEAVEMLGLVRELAHSGQLTIVIITHKLKEVAQFVDEVTVLRRGRAVGTGLVRDLGPADLTAMMIGEPHAPENPERHGAPVAEIRLEVQALKTAEDGGRKGLDVERAEGARARDRRHRRRVRQRPEGAAGGAGRPAPGGKRRDHRRWRRLRCKPRGVAGARRAGAAGGAAAQRLRAADDGGG